jgi:Tfp pilus assembly protein PilX
VEPHLAYSLAGAATAVVLLQALTLYTVHRQRTRLASLDERMHGLTRATSLLTDSTESGLRDLLHRLEQQAGPASALRPASVRSARGATTRRIRGAARHGRSVPEIAATEAMSEGEVRLRLVLASEEAAS